MEKQEPKEGHPGAHNEDHAVGDTRQLHTRVRVLPSAVPCPAHMPLLCRWTGMGSSGWVHPQSLAKAPGCQEGG